MSLVTLITPTGARPEAFTLCQKYMARQTYKGPIQWVVTSDIPSEPLQPSALIEARKNISMEIYFGPLDYRPGINTQRMNMWECLKHVKGDFIFIIEDDEFYSKDYIETSMYLLNKWPIVGQSNSHYYNIKVRAYKEWHNYSHTSLCETALRKEKLDLLDRAVHSGQTFFDMALYEIIRNEGHKSLLYNHQGLVYGMKGLPGKIGIGGGHHELKEQGFISDPFFDILRKWLGLEDAKEYIKIAQGQK